MNDTETIVSVTILDKTYPIRCAHNEVAELQQAAAHLNEHLKKLRQKTTKVEAITIVAALNISHELIQLKHQANAQLEQINRQIHGLSAHIQEALASPEEMRV